MSEEDLLKVVFLGHIPDNYDPVDVATLLFNQQLLTSSLMNLVLETFVNRALQQPTPMEIVAHYRKSHRKLYKLIPEKPSHNPMNRQKFMEIATHNATVSQFNRRFHRELTKLMDIPPEE